MEERAALQETTEDRFESVSDEELVEVTGGNPIGHLGGILTDIQG